ncbi:MAG: DNA repair protein RecO [Lachnospiraceae bacterium]|nr:DNA repair protein RecO [Lachnospiraceae bacterium]
MFAPLNLKGMVLSQTPVGDYDRRLVLLTRERGKITAFARGARRANSPLMGATQPFCMGSFSVTEGRDYYRLSQAEITEHFEEIRLDFEATCYGCYFLEWADYYGREFIEAKETLNLLWQSLRALLNTAIPNSLVRIVFEVRIMAINGENPEPEGEGRNVSTVYTLDYAAHAPLEKLYRFVVTPEVEAELRDILDRHIARVVDRRFRSLELLI